jgi:hypothetical protein
MKSKFLLPLIFLLLPIFSCNKSEEFQFTLYSEYTDNANNCKTIKVTVDGQEILMSQICFIGISPNVLTSSFSVLAGKHTLKAVIIDDSRVFEQEVEFSASQKYGYLSFNNKTSEFYFFMSSTGGIMK